MKRGMAVGLVVGLATCGACGSGEPETFTASGYISLLAGGNEIVGAGCSGTGGYDDIRPGAQVVVTNADGKRVGLGQLDIGEPATYDTCQLPFSVSDIPSGQGPYAAEVSSRGEVAFDEDSARSLKFSLG